MSEGEHNITFSLQEEHSDESPEVTYTQLLHEVDMLELTTQSTMDDYGKKNIYQCRFDLNERFVLEIKC